jgi:serine/threonine protein kinase
VVIGRYEVKELIKEGGMGAVYLARDPTIERVVAIKLVKGDVDAAARRRFAREARAARGLRHPNIVTVHDFGEFQEAPYLVMEYVDGTTIAEIVRHRTPMTLERKLRLMAALCDGLQYAHRHNVIHRDIKPANLIVDEHGVLKILDFGLARLSETTQPSMTAVAGTPGYLAPEQLHGAAPDAKSDMFAAGAVCYELLSYTPAFMRDEDTPAAVMMRIMQGELEPLSEVCHGIPPAVEHIVHTALASSPEARFPDVGVMKAALDEAADRVRRQRAPAANSASRRTTELLTAPVTTRPAPTPAPEAETVSSPHVLDSRPPVVSEIRPLTRPRVLAAIAAAAVIAFAAGAAFATWWTAASGDSPASGTLVIAEQTASTDRQAPTPLALGEVVTARLDAGGQTEPGHYWLVDLPSGDYKLVVDARRTDDAESNLGASLEWVEPDGSTRNALGSINAIASRTRSIFRFSTAARRPAVLRYRNTFGMADYWLGLFRAADPVPAPFFANPPAVEPLTLGQISATARHDSQSAAGRQAWASLSLEAGDYTVTARFWHLGSDARNLIGTVDVLDSQGEPLVSRLVTLNQIGTTASESARLSVPVSGLVFLRRLTTIDGLHSTVVVERFAER